ALLVVTTGLLFAICIFTPLVLRVLNQASVAGTSQREWPSVGDRAPSLRLSSPDWIPTNALLSALRLQSPNLRALDWLRRPMTLNRSSTSFRHCAVPLMSSVLPYRKETHPMTTGPPAISTGGSHLAAAMAFQGPSGAGKTSLGTCFPHPIFVMVRDQGLLP